MKELSKALIAFATFLVVLLPSYVHAQNQKTRLDSLIEGVDTVKDFNSIPSKRIMNLAGYYEKTGIDSLLSLEKAQKEGMNKVELLREIGKHYDVMRTVPSVEKALEYFTQELQLSRKLNFNAGVFHACNSIGDIYYRFCNYPEAEKYYLLSLSAAAKWNIDWAIGVGFSNMASIYQIQHNYPVALKYYDSSLIKLQASGNKEGISYAYRDMGEMYEAEKNYPEALKYSFLALNTNKKAFWKKPNHIDGVIMNNIGDIYQAEGNYKEAQKYYSIILDSGVKQHFPGLNNGEVLAATYLKSGTLKIRIKDYLTAEQYLNKGLSIARVCGARDIVSECYQKLAELCTETRDYPGALKNYTLYMSVKDSITTTETSVKLVQMQMEYDFDKKEAEQVVAQEKKDAIQKAESNRKTIMAGSAGVIAIFTLILALVLINRQHLKRKKDKIIYENNLLLTEKEKDLLKLEKQMVEDELANAKVILDEHITAMMEKNELLEQFKADVESLKKLKAKEIDENRVEHLENLNKTTILTEEDWSKFKELFEHVHKGFFIRQKEKLPELTQAEIRLLCLTKLKLDTKQMGGILGVSADTIHKSRYRLRKKLALAKENSIEDLVNTI